jgi:hypothetical protein
VCEGLTGVDSGRLLLCVITHLLLLLRWGDSTARFWLVFDTKDHSSAAPSYGTVRHQYHFQLQGCTELGKGWASGTWKHQTCSRKSCYLPGSGHCLTNMQQAGTCRVPSALVTLWTFLGFSVSYCNIDVCQGQVLG